MALLPWALFILLQKDPAVENSKLTDRELLEDIQKRVKRIERHETIQFVIVILAFVGIASLHQLTKKK